MEEPQETEKTAEEEHLIFISLWGLVLISHSIRLSMYLSEFLQKGTKTGG